MLDLLAARGCEGVEFSQRPEQLGDPIKLDQLLADRGLTLLGRRKAFFGDDVPHHKWRSSVLLLTACRSGLRRNYNKHSVRD